MDKRVLQKLGFDTIQKRLAEYTISSLGEAAALSLEPASEVAAVLALQAQTKEAEQVLMGSDSAPLRGFSDVSQEIARLRLGAALSCAELLRVAVLHKASKHAQHRIVEYSEGGAVRTMASNLQFDDALIGRIDEAIVGEDELSDNASGELRSIRRRMRSEHSFVREKLNSMIRSKDNASYLQEAIITERDGRFVVPVKQEYRSNVPGIIHSQSASGATLFIEPAGIVEANNRLRLLEEEEKREIMRILAEISTQAAETVEGMHASLDILAKLDLIFAKATMALKMRAMPPAFTENGVIDIKEGRHPLIADSEVIPVSIHTTEDIKTLIITGPNTGGKTVTLKMIGLFALMAQSGLYLPVKEGTALPIFPSVFADIGDEQSIEQSLSTFSAHMHNTIFILRRAEPGSLVLLDELGAGTDPEEGTALALAILDELYKRGAHVFATTHYGEIKAYALSQEGFENASMEFDPNSLMPTYRLIMGVAGASNAFLISKRLGLKNDIIERARSFMEEERVAFDALLLEAERTRKNTEQRLIEANQKLAEAKEIEKKAKALEADLANRRRTAIEKAQQEASEIVKTAQEEMEAVLKEARKTRGQTEREATQTTEKLRKDVRAKREVLAKQTHKKKTAAALLQPEDIHIGDAVRVISLNVDGTVQAPPDNKGMVGVQAGIMTLMIHYSDLAAKNGVQSKKQVVRGGGSIKRVHNPVGLSINLHGYNVEEAIAEIDKYLDDAFLSGLQEVSIIHGKGTGVLRKGVHEYLRKHPHVDTFRLGTYGEGETGVTIVTLK